jgi:hypothetical protein
VWIHTGRASGHRAGVNQVGGDLIRAISWAGQTPAIEVAAYLVKRALLFFTVGIALAQDPTAQHTPADHSAKQHEPHKGPDAFEAEFVASNIFRSGSYVQSLWRGLGFEGHYFGSKATNAGFTGASWTFGVRKLELSPGFGVLFGSKQFTTSPAVSFRWNYEHGWFVSQGLFLRGFRETPVFAEDEESGEHHSDSPAPLYYARPKISDGNHFSARWKRLEIGGTFEHIEFREGSEWKGGGRLGIRLFPRVSAILYVLSPGKTEWRGGILIHPPPHE